MDTAPTTTAPSAPPADVRRADDHDYWTPEREKSLIERSAKWDEALDQADLGPDAD